MRLTYLDPTSYDRSFEICNFGFRIERRIHGEPWREFVGKGALDQPTKTVAVWNTGGEVTR